MNREEFIKDFTKLGVILTDFCEYERNHQVLIEAITETKKANDFFIIYSYLYIMYFFLLINL